MFKLNLELQQAKQTEEVAKPRLTIPQNNNDGEVKSRVPYVSQTTSQVKPKINSVTIVTDAIKNLESGLQKNCR
jgi:hypothetical protein